VLLSPSSSGDCTRRFPRLASTSGQSNLRFLSETLSDTSLPSDAPAGTRPSSSRVLRLSMATCRRDPLPRSSSAPSSTSSCTDTATRGGTSGPTSAEQPVRPKRLCRSDSFASPLTPRILLSLSLSGHWIQPPAARHVHRPRLDRNHHGQLVGQQPRLYREVLRPQEEIEHFLPLDTRSRLNPSPSPSLSFSYPCRSLDSLLFLRFECTRCTGFASFLSSWFILLPSASVTDRDQPQETLILRSPDCLPPSWKREKESVGLGFRTSAHGERRDSA
jgi:hypothetical protein